LTCKTRIMSGSAGGLLLSGRVTASVHRKSEASDVVVKAATCAAEDFR
jgi:hypothetical protein